MLYDDAHQFFGWPDRPQVFDPKGAGARAYADEVKRKIGAELRRQFPNLTVEAGVLAADPNSDSTEAPIAIVCEFPHGADEKALKQAHRLAWNFSRTALLITLEPYRLLAWSCWLDPQKDESPQVQELRELPKTPGATLNALQASARDLLHWVSLITGNYLKLQPEKFRSDGRADALLLDNLRVVRQELLSLGLDREYCHDLLARIIFAQFLFHRKDSEGRPFLDKNLLDGRCEGKLNDVHEGLDTILDDGDETYRFFRWLDERFNGDLFPGKENQTEVERDEAWRREKEAVAKNPVVLKRLSEFVSGKLRLKNRQLTLWPEYSFDIIPLEFISSVYEEFLTGHKPTIKAYYTPSHLVDFVLDGVLPWNDDRYDLRILDPCCGSGIFLVKAFQRLIHRWRRTHDADPLVSDLKPILANNLWGVDRDPEAVRVACFSLYLAMADAIEPRYYLKREKVFPRLRGIRLLARDFFDETTEGFRTKEDAETFDLVIGNAPWGRHSIKDASDSTASETQSGPLSPRKNEDRSRQAESLPTKAEKWAQTHEWPVPYLDISPLFVAKGARLTKTGGYVAMIQSASVLLYQRASRATALRRKLFATFAVEEITNLSALRRQLFDEAVGPACVIVLRNNAPAPGDALYYFCPKPLYDSAIGQGLVIEPQDAHELTHYEAANDPLVWSALAIGGRRDLQLVHRLNREHKSLAVLEREAVLETGEGITWGNREREATWMKNRRILSEDEFPENTFLSLQARLLPKNQEIKAQWPRRESLFAPAQLLIKAMWTVGQQRFQAALVDPDEAGRGALCTQAYVSVHADPTYSSVLHSAWLAYNSRFAVYYLLLTSSRLGHFIPEPLVKEILAVPLPENLPGLLDGLRDWSDVDQRMVKRLNLSQAEEPLVDDLLGIVFQDILGGETSVGRQPTLRRSDLKLSEASGLGVYLESFVRVLKATFGKEKQVCATIFVEPDDECLPVRMAAIHLDWPRRRLLSREPMDKDGLLEKLRLLYRDALSPKNRALSGDGLGFQRVAFLFQSHVEGGRRIPSLYVIKPDQRRYWTRSLAMRDADQLAGAILRAAGHKESTS